MVTGNKKTKKLLLFVVVLDRVVALKEVTSLAVMLLFVTFLSAKGRARTSRLLLSSKFIYRQNQRLQDLYHKKKKKGIITSIISFIQGIT
jgi:hypothetical protein